MIQKFSGTDRLYWTVELSQGGGLFGPFVNRNNAGGFLNLCMAASLGLLLYVTRPRDPDRTSQRRPDPSSSLTTRVVASLADHLPELANLTAVRLGLFAVSGLIVAAVLCTLSRGAFLAMTGGAAVTLLAVLATRRSGGAAIFVSLGVAGMLLLAWVGMTETVQRRLATILPAPEGGPHELIPHWQDALSAIPDFWLLGSGLGTYRFAYRPYERERSDVVFYHAENLYVETLLETGIIGLVLVIAAWVLVAAAAWDVTRVSDRTRGSPLAFAGIFLVASQAIHSTTDFGLYIPANAVWFAVLCGSLVGCATHERRNTRSTAWHRSRAARDTALPREEVLAGQRASGTRAPRLAAVLLPVGAVGLLLLAVIGALDSRNSIASARALRACRLFQRDAKQAGVSRAQKVERTIAELVQALPAVWSDAEIHQALAEFYVTRYRLEASDAWDGPANAPAGALPDSKADIQPSDQRAVKPNDVPDVGSVHDPLLLSARLQHLPESERDAARRSLEADPAVQRSLLPAVRHALWAREFCPLLPRVEMRLAELRFLLRSGDSDAVYLDRARLLAGPDAGLWFGAGLLDWYADRPDAAYRSWRRSLELSDRYQDPILAWSTSRLAPAEVPTRVLPDKPGVLLAAARYLYSSDDAVVERRQLFEKALTLLADQSRPLTGEELHLKVQLLRQLGQKELAFETCQAALAQEPRQVDCRFELADMLFQEGQIEQSLWQLEIVLDQAPGHGGASAQAVRRKIPQEGQRLPETRQRARRQ
jgi:hypothetical protein